MAGSLNQALERNELVPYLLPRWCTSSQRVVSAEVLVRWQHPSRGLLLPADFLPFAQANGRMARITQRMLQCTVKLLHNELPTHQLSVNLSAADLREPGLVPLLQQLLLAQGISAHRLCLEVAEKAVLAGGAEATARLAELRQLGVGVAIDDFGTGPSPLAQLRNLPASELKLDNSYIVDVDSNPGRQQLLQSIIDMAHNLNLTVTAKGVETPGEREVLEMLGCDFMQGHLIGRPMPVQAFVAGALAQAPAQQPVQAPVSSEAS
jgi:EAL domain-containing protein (putative c-di-GMP-specific phosphodiesterase class I)